MSDESKNAKPGIAKWFLETFFRSPSTWIGLAAGTASGMAFVQNGPESVAVGFGMVVAFVAGVMSWAPDLKEVLMSAPAHSAEDEERQFLDRCRFMPRKVVSVIDANPEQKVQ
jgi:hypothetical protein